MNNGNGKVENLKSFSYKVAVLITLITLFVQKQYNLFPKGERGKEPSGIVSSD